MDDANELKCCFCDEAINSDKDRVVHRDNNGSAYIICRKCVAVAARRMGMKGIVEPPAEVNTKKPDEKTNIIIKSPKEIYYGLKNYVVGQDAYLQALAMFGHQHLARTARIVDGASQDNIPKQNLFSVGNSGTGKTLAATLLCRMLQIPVYVGDMTSITMTGYIGGDVLDLLRYLVNTSKGVFDHGILVLDEVDKIRTRTTRVGDRDINGEGVQETLLKIIEGTKIEIPFWVDGKADRKSVETRTIDTSRISVIACGAFNDMDFTDKKKRMEKSIGFRTKNIGHTEKIGTDEIIKRLVDAGMLPEFVNRFQRFVLLNDLSIDDYKNILYSPADSLIRRETERFANEGLQLIVDDSAIGFVAEKAYRLGLGARCLQAELSQILDEVAFDNFSSGRTGTVIVSADTAGNLSAKLKENGSCDRRMDRVDGKKAEATVCGS